MIIILMRRKRIIQLKHTTPPKNKSFKNLRAPYTISISLRKNQERECISLRRQREGDRERERERERER